MKQRRLDRITIAEFCQSPIDLWLALPLSIPKNKVLEKATEYLRKINIKTKQEKGYFRIVKRNIKKTTFDSYDLSSNSNIQYDWTYSKWTIYHCWAIKIDFIYKGETITRQIKPKGKKLFGIRKRLQVQRTKREIEKLMLEYWDEILEGE